MYLQCLDEDKYESAVLGGWSVACVYVCVIYELLSSQLSTRVKFTYINSKKKVNIHSNGNCKPGANSLWFNSFTLEISLTFLGQTVSHLEIHTFMAREKAERCSFHLRFPPPQSLPLKGWVLGGSWREGFLWSVCPCEVLETHRCSILSLVRGGRPQGLQLQIIGLADGLEDDSCIKGQRHTARLPVPQSTHSRPVIDLSRKQARGWAHWEL